MINYKRMELSVILEELNKIEVKQDRINELRRICGELPVLSLLIQYCYHPEVEFDLPPEDPKEIEYRVNEFPESTSLYGRIRKLPTLFKSNQSMTQSKKYQVFISILSTITSNDAKLLIAVKNKRLPQRRITEKFCTEALPELFPATFLEKLSKQVGEKD